MRDLLIKVRPVLVKQQQTTFTLILAAALKPTPEKKSQSNKVQMHQTDPEPPSFLRLSFSLFISATTCKFHSPLKVVRQSSDALSLVSESPAGLFLTKRAEQRSP